ncbi:MAG TPA: proton-conducting transporter membrane subunit [Chitinophagales bacterium]|nr:proton-conducting transporter membrane subunit [Chitinophagales bacterium]
MTDHNIIWPVLVHAFTAVLLVFFWKRVTPQRVISIAGCTVSLAIGVMLFIRVWNKGILTMQAGNWQAPFGITFVADTFSAMMVMLTGIAGLAVCIFSTVGLSVNRMQYGYFPIFHFLLMGLNGAFLTGDIFNLYVWFEIIIIASFVLMTLGGKKQQLEGGIKYVTMNLLASVIFLTATGVLYGLVGTLNMADLSIKVAQVENRGLVDVVAILFLVGFGIKSAVFPLYFWLPSSYHAPPAAVAAIFGGLLTKVGIYALLRVFTLIFVPDPFIANVLIGIAVGTLLAGTFGALVQRNMRQLFSYLIVCHIGYMIAGLGMFTQAALTGALFYLVHDIVVKTNLFMVSGLINKIRGTMEIRELGSLYRDYPRLTLLFAVVLFSLVGVPPLSGFWPKIFLITAAFDSKSCLVLAAIVVASFATLFVIARLWSEVFWKDAPPAEAPLVDYFQRMQRIGKTALVVPVVALAAVSLYIGFAAENINAVAAHVATDLLNPSAYIEAVLGPDAMRPMPSVTETPGTLNNLEMPEPRQTP